MYLKLIRNQPKGSAITGRLVIDGRWFCNTLERKGYEILALCYPVRVTHSPKFKRLLPLVCGVPQTEAKRREAKGERQGIRFHRGTRPEHSTGCILVPADKESELTNLLIETQKHEEILLEIIDPRSATDCSYAPSNSRKLQKP